jgi:hypothetical protein
MREFRVRGRMVTLYRVVQLIEANSPEEAESMAQSLEDKIIKEGTYMKEESLKTRLAKILSVQPV